MTVVITIRINRGFDFEALYVGMLHACVTNEKEEYIGETEKMLDSGVHVEGIFKVQTTAIFVRQKKIKKKLKLQIQPVKCNETLLSAYKEKGWIMISSQTKVWQQQNNNNNNNKINI